MSDTPNGPGWWLASDGKYYPPQPTPAPMAHPQPASSPQPTMPVTPGSPTSTPIPPLPGYLPPAGMPPYAAPPQYGTPHYVAPTQGTNGMAIASLTLSLLWLCGIGSILAVIFGIIAIKQINSRGQGGKGIAIAGLIIGGLGLISTVAVGAVVATQADQIIEMDSDESDDVEILNCSTDQDTGVALLEVTNDSSKASTYIVSIEFNGESSANVANVPVLDPGESTQIEVRSSGSITGDARCRVEYVQRFAAE